MVYPTGYSDQGIDFSQASQNLQNSALQLQVAQAKTRMGELSEAQKYILKSADMSVIPEVSGDLRNKFQDEINGIRQKTIDLVRQRNGKLTASDMSEIERMGVEQQNRQARAKLNIEALKKMQETFLKPGIDEVIDMPKARARWGELSTALQKGEDIGTDVMAIPIQYAITKSEGQLFTDQMQKQIAQLGTNGKLQYHKGKMIVTTATDEADARNAVRQQLLGNSMWLNQITQKDDQGNILYNAGKPVIDEDKLKAKEDQFLPLVTKTKTEEKPLPASMTRKGGTSANPLLDLTWESGKIGNQDYANLTTLPSPTKTTANVVSARNEDTGAEEKPSGSYEITPTHIGVTPQGEGRIIYSAPGAPKMVDGKQVYSSDGKDHGALTLDEAKKGQEAAAKNLLPDRGKDWTIVGEPDVQKGDNGVTLKYTAKREYNWAQHKLGYEDKKQSVEVKLKPVIDDKANGMRSMPINKANINLIPQATLNRKTQNDKGQTVKLIDYLQDLMSRPKGQAPAYSQGSQSEDYGKRPDGTQKQNGFLGVLQRPDGRVSTEISIGTEINGKEMDIPTLVPTLTEAEKQYLLNTDEGDIFTKDKVMFKAIQSKAIAHAEKRISEGKSPFASNNESPTSSPKGTSSTPTLKEAQEKFHAVPLQ